MPKGTFTQGSPPPRNQFQEKFMFARLKFATVEAALRAEDWSELFIAASRLAEAAKWLKENDQCRSPGN